MPKYKVSIDIVLEEDAEPGVIVGFFKQVVQPWDDSPHIEVQELPE